jgi:hypothetical protein
MAGDQMTDHKRNHERAVTAAAEYRRLAAAGDYARADQIARTIEDLAGRWTWSARLGHRLALPADVARAMRGGR